MKPVSTVHVYLECHLSGEDQLVSFKETSGCVHEDTVGDAVRQVVHPELDVVRGCGPLDGHVEDNAEGFQRKLKTKKLFFMTLGQSRN